MPTRYKSLVAVSTILSLVLVARICVADDNVSGPNSAYASASLVVPGVDTALVTATIPSGKAGRVLVVHATLVDYNSSAGTNQSYYYVPKVNGQYLEPSRDGSYALAKVNNASNIFPFGTVVSSGTWWLDLDEYGLVGQLLTIELRGSSYPVGGVQTRTANVSLVAIMEVK